MYITSKRGCSMTKCRIVFDDRLRERFCERIRQQPANPIHPRYQMKRVCSTEKDSAVLIPLVHFEGSPSIIFTHRSLLLAGHRGEVSFPGGRLEGGETPGQAALRESEEEIGLNMCQVKIWGYLRPVATRNFTSVVTPVVGLVEDVDFNTIRARYDEVQTVFAAPVDELCVRHGYTNFRTDDVQYKLPVFFTSRHRIIATNVEPQKQYRIWGLTAGMLHLALLNLFPKFYQSEVEIPTLIN